MSSKKEKLKNLKKQTKSNNHSKKKKKCLKKTSQSKKNTIKKNEVGGSRFFQGYKMNPDYSVNSITINSYSGYNYPLKCSVCKGEQFMVGQGLIKSGRIINNPLLMDKHSIMCVCANCSHIMWFRKSTFVNKTRKWYNRDYGYSYSSKALDPYQTRPGANEPVVTTETSPKPSAWSNLTNFLVGPRRRR